MELVPRFRALPSMDGPLIMVIEELVVVPYPLAGGNWSLRFPVPQQW